MRRHRQHAFAFELVLLNARIADPLRRFYALKPDVTVIAPWREWDLTSRTKLLEFAEANQIPIAKDKRGEAPFSVDANLLHTSSEGKVLENPAEEAPEPEASAEPESPSAEPEPPPESSASNLPKGFRPKK